MSDDAEFAALAAVYAALKDLDNEARQRVLDYVSRKLGLSDPSADRTPSTEHRREEHEAPTSESVQRNDRSEDDVVEGISPIAQKWMRRNDLSVQMLGKLFSLGADEIDLVAKTIPGGAKRARTRNVVLLKAVAAYMSTGAARISGEQIKEACLHYDAFDGPNHAAILKGMNSELTGSKSAGFTLTARGMTSATELVKSMLA